MRPQQASADFITKISIINARAYLSSVYYVLETFDDVGQVEPVPAVANDVRPQLLKGNVEILIDIGRPQLIGICPALVRGVRVSVCVRV